MVLENALSVFFVFGKTCSIRFLQAGQNVFNPFSRTVFFTFSTFWLSPKAQAWEAEPPEPKKPSLARPDRFLTFSNRFQYVFYLGWGWDSFCRKSTQPPRPCSTRFLDRCFSPVFRVRVQPVFRLTVCLPFSTRTRK